ncbi:hypothetical protein [Planctomicrobium sp. SH527]|uniref:hypothetical protein n=1 Tax=Planctomicrobium sp. SH527 TaxID=3448123 RepID=UPI003F5AF579
MRNSFNSSTVICCGLLFTFLFAHAGQCPGQPPATGKSPVAEQPAPLSLRPYQVAVVLSAPGPSAIANTTLEGWATDCKQLLASWHSGSWKTDIHLASSSITSEALMAPTRTASAPDWHIANSDKTICVSVSNHAGSQLITCREWDQLSQTYGAVYRAECHDEREFINEMATAVTQAFRPLLEIQVRPNGEIEGVIQAGEFPSHQLIASTINHGDILLPFLRVLNRRQELVAIQQIPWTYLQIESTDRARAQCKLHSTFRSPFPNPSRRVSAWALRERPLPLKTVVTIIPRGKKQNPLAATRCELIDIPHVSAAKVESTPESESAATHTESNTTTETPATAAPVPLLTSREGSLVLTGDPEHPLKQLTVFSGNSVLAKVPIVAGIVPRLELDVPDDSARLAVEGEIAIMESELLDLVATREIVMARIRTAADQERWTKVDSLLTELDQLPSQQAFLAKIEKLQLNSVFAAQQANDRVAEIRIERLCEAIRVSAQKHLDHTRLNDLKTNVTSERKLFEKRSM